MLRVGIDIGGTFTDFIAWRLKDGRSQSVNLKVPSTPGNYAEGFISGLEQVLAQFGDVADEDLMIVHGTTISTNTVIERKADPIALLTTEGFRDVLNIQRLRLRKPTNLFEQRTPPLVPRELVFEVEERTLFDGSIRKPIDPEQVKACAREALARGATGFAIALYHSYRNDEHERIAREAVREVAGDVEISISSEIWPQVGEYERSMVAVLNAFVQPKMAGYLTQIEGYLAENLPKARLFITRSNGGAMSTEEARRFPVHTLLSGPASGVTATIDMSKRLGNIAQCLTFDMGGTSTDVSLIRNNQQMTSTTSEVGDFPVSMPVTDIEAIGAGGGSIITMDGPVLRVGPQSAGARPGPAAFGHGGTQPAVSDAYVLCGMIDPENFLGGRMKLDAAAAERAISPVAEAMNTDIRTSAEAALNVATSNMVARVMPYLARHGVDPEDVTLVTFGGAGSLHGPLLARELGIRKVVIPTTPSVFCASGGLVTRLVNDAVITVHGMELTAQLLKDGFAELQTRSADWLAQQVEAEQIVETNYDRFVEARYRGQSFQILIPVGDAVAEGDMEALRAAFHAEHQRLYSHSDPEGEVEVLQLRTRVLGALPAPVAEPIGRAADATQALTGSRNIRLEGGEHLAQVYDRARLSAGAILAGPAIVEQHDTTILVPIGFSCTVNAEGELELELEKE
ncbi:hydantoinase/oxoprolinase family protein [Yangia mangrovi]|uniref:Hydantoinase/oxoprolinase family protein n=1 Tax=Alloyangia mangrovi TaxID=1779329 RepID=A0ABT2KK96_9RHOB|nr:hydantoinase/oxoprolinase family protein [Alloyangia mangrovi]MCT4370779.1 hydantoinase/oxoprolinase family protein [Alloyangia mangrovi]